jgi:hypothetical protein
MERLFWFKAPPCNAYNAPVVAANRAAIPELGDDGLLVKPEAVQAMADSIAPGHQ